MFWRNNRPEISMLQHDVAHITFSVRNGKALLRPSVIHDPDSDAGIHTLSWHGSPLIRFTLKPGAQPAQNLFMPVLAMMMKAPRSFYPHLPSGISQESG